MTEFLYICGIKVIGTNNLKHRNMKKNKLWMLAAYGRDVLPAR